MRRRHLLAVPVATLAATAGGRAVAGAYEDFFAAIDIDDAQTMRRLLARGMDPNTRDPKGQHPLFLALRSGSRQVVDVLIQARDTEVDAVNAVGETPLMMAALRGDLDAMQALVRRGARVDRDGWTPLHYAASGPSLPAIRWLLEQGVRVDTRSPNGNTPLLLAARYGPIDGAVLLLERGASARARNDNGHDAASYARLAGRETLAERLEAAAR